MIPPRFRGNAIEHDNQWGWECFCSPLGSEEILFAFGNKKTFPTKEEAVKDMMKAVEEACDIWHEVNGLTSSGQYIDIKTNETLNFNKEKYN